MLMQRFLDKIHEKYTLEDFTSNLEPLITSVISEEQIIKTTIFLEELYNIAVETKNLETSSK